MADRFPLIVDADNTNIKELPSGDNLDLTGSDIVNVVDVTTSGNMVVGGNLTVNGTTTTINSATLEIDDKNIVLASGAADAAAADGAGISIDGASANLTYSSSSDEFSFNKGVTVPSLTTTGNISFGDNDKALFGAGSDLQIYHDGSNSYISEVGTGELVIQARDAVTIEDGTSGDNYLYMQRGNKVSLFYAGAEKLATSSTGIDVTGSVVSDGLTVDGNASVAGTVGVTADNGTITTGKDSASSRTHWSMNNPNGEVAKWDSNGTDLLHYITDEYKVFTAGNKAFEIDGNGDISFYEDTGTTAKFFWDAAAESLGIGTDSPAAFLSFGANIPSDGQTLHTYHSGNIRSGLGIVSGVHRLFTDSGSALSFGQVSTSDGSTYAERMQIDSSGNVGIGTSSPNSNGGSNATVCHIHSSGTGAWAVNHYTNGTTGDQTSDGFLAGIVASDAYLYNYESGNIIFGTSNAEVARIDSSGNVGIGTSSPSSILHAVGSTGIILGAASGDTWQTAAIKPIDEGASYKGTLAFYTHPSAGSAGSPTERMRIDSSGNLLVGKTTSGIGVTGTSVLSNGQLLVTADGDNPVDFNRKTSDGIIALFRKDGTSVGSIGNTTTSLFIGSGDVGLRFDGANDRIRPVGNASDLGSSRDNAIDLGDLGARFDDIYATNGTIQTSDRNEKQDIAELSDAEQRVAVAAKGLLRKFRWKSSVADKGDDARIHFGIIAQDLQAAFEAEGLDAGRYAMFINSTWTDEETGEERTRRGVRYSELLAFIISAI